MKKLLFFFLLGVICIGFLFPNNANAEKYELKLGHLSAVGGLEDIVANKIAEEAYKNSNGQLVINVFPASQLGSSVSEIESIQMGTQDIFWGALGWLGNFVKDYQILLMPYAFRSQDHQLDFIDSPIALELEKKLEDIGLLLMTKHSHGLPKVLLTSKPVFSVKDLKGLLMRVPEWPVSMKAWKALGTNITVVAWGELYLALAQGVAEGMECGFEFIYPGKFHEVAKYILKTEHCYELRGAIVGKKSYEKLPKDLQKVLMDALHTGEELYNEPLDKIEQEDTRNILKSGGVIIEVDREPFKKILLPLVDELEAEGYWRKGLFDEVQDIKGPRSATN